MCIFQEIMPLRLGFIRAWFVGGGLMFNQEGDGIQRDFVNHHIYETHNDFVNQVNHETHNHIVNHIRSETHDKFVSQFKYETHTILAEVSK